MLYKLLFNPNANITNKFIMFNVLYIKFNKIIDERNWIFSSPRCKKKTLRVIRRVFELISISQLTF